MRFKTDEDIHPDVAGLLSDVGQDVVTVWDQGLRGKPDEDLAGICRSEERVLIMQDLDFANIRLYPPGDYPGIIVMRLYSQSRRSQLAVVHRLMPCLQTEPLCGRLWIVDETRLRIHGETQ